MSLERDMDTNTSCMALVVGAGFIIVLILLGMYFAIKH